MAEYVQIAKEYLDVVTDTAKPRITWAKMLAMTSANYAITEGPHGIAATYTIYFPFEDSGESATSGGAVTAGTKTAVSVDVTLVERNSKKLKLHALATLTASTPQDIEIVRQLTSNWINEINTYCKTYAMSTIPDSGNYTHAVNNSGAGGAQDVITAGYVYLGSAVSASESALTSVVAGDNLTPAIFRKMIDTLRARRQFPIMIEGADMFLCFAQRQQVAYMKSHADFKANVNANISDRAWSALQIIFGTDIFLYEGALVISVDDALKASTVGAGGTDTAHYCVFMGDGFIGFPHKMPQDLPVSATAAVERMPIFDQAEIRFGSETADAPLYKTMSAAWYSIYGIGIINPLAAIKLVLHSDAA